MVQGDRGITEKVTKRLASDLYHLPVQAANEMAMVRGSRARYCVNIYRPAK